MSTISFTLTTQALDFSPQTRGNILVTFNDGNQNFNLSLALINGIATSGYFQEVAWDNPNVEDSDDQQAENYRNAFNRDYKNIGGTKNLAASRVDNTITITATVGTFVSASYSGNVLVFSGLDINNTTQVVPANLTITASSTGNCNTIQHAFVATGDGAPFRVNRGGNDLISDWDGTSENLNLDRTGTTQVYFLYNSDDELVDTVAQFVPRKLAEGDFDIEINQYEDSADVIVNRIVFLASTAPLEYSIDAVSATTGGSYQTSNTFAGVFSGQYKVFIKDKYGCEISKNIVVTEFQDATENEVTRYFEIMEGQSFCFSPHVQHTALVKKNYFNTWSYNEYVQGAKYNTFHIVDALDGFRGVQFKSSYNWHYITMHKCDGTKVNIPPILISQNLGAKEKFDCMLYPSPDVDGETWVYFNGGNEYTADTTTVIGSSPYDGTTPTWAQIDQLVFVDDTGLRITKTGYDANIGGYFVVELETASETSGFVQVTYNKHPYNLYEFYVNISDIDNSCVIVVEKAFDGEGLIEGDPWVSERIKKKEDSDDILYLEWNDTKNKADIVFQSGLKCFARYEGVVRPTDDTDSDTYSGDGNVYSISQVSRIDFNIKIEGITYKQVNQLNIASALSGFKCNGISLVAKESASVTPLGVSNLFRWERTFGYGTNALAEQQDEIVYSPTTGVDGGGGDGISETPDLSGITLIVDSDGNLIKDDNGNLIKI
jgi:hypothetical protein